LRYFADRFGIPRAGIEGTQLPMGLVRRHATTTGGTLVVGTSGARDALILSQRVTYHGFELERDDEALDDFPPGKEGDAREALASALAAGEARHPAVRRNRRAVEEMRELYRRSGGLTPRLNQADLAGRYLELLGDISSMDQFRSLPLKLDLWPLVTPAERERLLALPSAVEVRGKWVDVEYDVERAGGSEQGVASDQRSAISDQRNADSERQDQVTEAVIPVARLRLPEKLARTLVDEELPQLDRPLRFVVHRGPRGAARGSTLAELQDVLDRPWSPDEPFEGRRPRRESKGGQRHERHKQGRGRGNDRKRRRR
jgi:hypothetical protein